MSVSYNQKIVTITANDLTKSIKFSLSSRVQLDELEHDYQPSEVASIDVEFVNDKEAIKGNTHRYITKKHYDSLERFLETARLHYNLA